MFLSRKEQKMLDGESGEAVQESMEILTALGKIYSAEKMIPVHSVQVAGVSYKTIGDAGLEYLQSFSKKGAKVVVPTFLNPAGMDRSDWKRMKVPEPFAKKQIEVMDAYESMGIMPTYTCAPYHIGIRPKKGQHIAWSESSAVAFANSVLGARTNREGGPSALAAGICGMTPCYGFHLDENRVSDFVVEVKAKLEDESDFGAMGAYVGKIVKDKIPTFTGLPPYIKEEKLKMLGAAMAASGSVALFYVKDSTPEFNLAKKYEKIEFGEKELKAIRAELNEVEKPELITIGCPHASVEQIRQVALAVRGKKLDCDLWVCTSRETKRKAGDLGYNKIIEDAGGIVIADTCMVVCPLEQMGYHITGANSGKAAKYLSSLCKQKVSFGGVRDLIARCTKK